MEKSESYSGELFRFSFPDIQPGTVPYLSDYSSMLVNSQVLLEILYSSLTAVK